MNMNLKWVVEDLVNSLCYFLLYDWFLLKDVLFMFYFFYLFSPNEV